MLVQRVLGQEARRYLRSSERLFPLFHEGVYFSVSHAGGVCVLAAAEVAVGIDVEPRFRQPGCDDLAWALSDGEREELELNGVGGVLTEIWTAKEAAGKALGVGLQAMPATIDSRPMSSAPSHRLVEMPSEHGTMARLDSCGSWWGDYHVRVAWTL